MSDRKVFHDSVAPFPKEGIAPEGFVVNSATDEHRKEPIKLHFSLNIPSQEELEDRVAAGQTVSNEDLHGKYAPARAEVDKLTTWLKSEGLEVQVTPDRTSVYVSGTAAQIENSLDVKMARVTKGGLGYTAALNAPSLPADIAGPVQAIIGLQPFRQAHKHLKALLPKAGNRALSAGPNPQPNIQNAPPYLVEEVLAAYNADNIGVTGAGQTIAILIDTVPLDSDLQAFWQRNGISVNLSQIKKINVKGGPLPVPEGEETLDVSWASGIAPGATIRIYASGSLAFVDLDAALDKILGDAMADKSIRQLSISLGLGELFMNQAPGEIAAQHQKYLQLAALGVNVFVSSGDAGSNPDETGHGFGPTPQVEYASSDPCVVGVGGTSLFLAGDGSVSKEIGWANGGGGKSVAFKHRPVWQRGTGVPGGRQRLVPDVSLTADPNEGAFLILNGVAQQFGGTSWSAPVWAAFCALINEARANAGKASLPFLNPLIYPLIGTSCFRDIVKGTNGAFDAVPGYDMVTGIGAPNVKALIAELTK
ncbi:peptidase S53 [Capsulimonas corticalis]|uniref:Peptidase S53 n=1 Tax=Capsulimonas corticalis TaxID=2219043 RepID=A0A402D1B6_9BACT|nr:S53 family peptidase [Capsulimonas corticalis]BDI31606.1 peptidase S53 [Capsulimonas corticalis]